MVKSGEYPKGTPFGFTISNCHLQHMNHTRKMVTVLKVEFITSSFINFLAAKSYKNRQLHIPATHILNFRYIQ